MLHTRTLKIALITLAVLLVGGVTAVIAYPRVGEWYVRTRILPRAEERLGRKLTVAGIKVRHGQVELDGVSVAGASATDPPLVTIAAIHADFDFWPALFGKLHLGELRVDEPVFTLTATAGGDNWSDLLAHLRGGTADGDGEAHGSKLPTKVTVTRGSVRLTDDRHGITVAVESIDGEVVPHGHAHLVLGGVAATHHLGPRLTAPRVDVDAEVDHPRETLKLAVSGGAAELTHSLSLSGITGVIATAPDAPGQARIELSGGYGGAESTLWRAEGSLDPIKQEGELHLRADRFTLDKIASVLVDTPIQSPEQTSIGGALDLTLKDGTLAFNGSLDVAGLTLFHPWVADDPVADLGFSAKIAGSWHERQRTLDLDHLVVDFRGVELQVDGALALVGGEEENGAPREKRRLRAHVAVPKVDCQVALNAIPPQLASRLQGFKLSGPFDADLHIDIDWANLDAVDLGGSVGINHCKVLAVPDEFKVDRLNGEFDHTVEVAENDFIQFTVGPSNPDFVPIAEVSPYLTQSLINTEDYGFLKHHGFITREFRTALISDLKEGYFKYGASSITMQLVKNVFLVREKTLSRKFQELFLTWYVESVLTKDRLMEIYVNVIEFGPGLYGIGPAARHYFGKTAKDINPTEAAFFSSILPNPKQRYMQYCEGQLNKWGDAKVQRILKLEHDRGLLTDEEYEHALAAPLEFDRTEALPEDECKEMTRKMIQKGRPTSPGKHAAVPPK